MNQSKQDLEIISDQNEIKDAEECKNHQAPEANDKLQSHEAQHSDERQNLLDSRSQLLGSLDKGTYAAIKPRIARQDTLEPQPQQQTLSRKVEEDNRKLIAAIDKLSRAILGLTKKNKEQEGIISDLDNQVLQMTSEINDRDHVIQITEDKVQTAKQEKEDIALKLDQERNKNSGLRKEIENLKYTLNEKDEALATLKDTIEAFKQSKSTLKKELQECEIEKSKLLIVEAEDAEVDAELRKAQENIQSLKTVISQQVAEKLEAVSLNIQLKTRSALLEKHKTESIEKVKEYKTLTEKHEEAIKRLRGELSDWKKQYNSLKIENTEFKVHLNALGANYRNLLPNPPQQ